MSTKVKIVTIDGPSGSGKGTIARLLADKLGWHMLDSGAIYRVLAYAALEQEIPATADTELAVLAAQLELRFQGEQVLLNNLDISRAIRDERCSDYASQIALYPAVRQALLQLQHDFAKPPGLVADGRDMGTVIFPDALLKIYLDASVSERAKRRVRQLKQAGFSANIDDLAREIEARDLRDKTRATAPLKPAADAILLDCSSLGIEQVLDRVLEHLQPLLSKP